MNIKTQAQLKKFGKNKNGVFNAPKKCVLVNKALNKVLIPAENSFNAAHGKNLFLMDETHQTLVLIEHLLISSQGVFLLEYIDFPKKYEPIGDVWWSIDKMDELVPNPLHLLKRKVSFVKSILKRATQKDIPVYAIPVSKTSLEEGVVSITDVYNHLVNLQGSQKFVLTQPEINDLKQVFISNHEKTYTEYLVHYSSQLCHSFYVPSLAQISNIEQFTLRVLNNFVYDNLRDAVILSNIEVPTRTSTLKPISYLIISSKGLLLLNILNGHAKYEGSIQDLRWKCLVDGEETHIENPITQCEMQIQALFNALKNTEIPISYRVICEEPCHVDIRHSSLVTSGNIDHALDRWMKQSSINLSEDVVLNLISAINNWK